MKSSLSYMRATGASLAAAIAAILTGTSTIAAAEPARSGIWLELPVVELPFNTSHDYRFPGMQQALSISTDGYQLLHFGVEQVLDPWRTQGWTRFAAIATMSAVDVLSFRLPGFAGAIRSASPTICP